MRSTKIQDILTWDDSYAIARELIKAHPEVEIESLSLSQVYEWAIRLPDFQDDPHLCNEAILMAILREWLEEVSST